MEIQRFAFSSSAYTAHSLKKALRRIAKVGFRGIEILADKPHAWLDSIGRGDVSKLQKQIESLDLYVSNINANQTSGFWTDAPAEPLYEPSLISRNRTLREWRIAYTKKALRLGKELGASSVSITSGRAVGMAPEKARKLLEEELQRLLEFAEHLQQRLALATEPTLLVESSSELRDLLKQINSPWLGANVNPAQMSAAGEDPFAAMKSLKGRIFNVHLEDIYGNKRYPRIPGDGEMDFRATFRTLDQIGYAGPLTWHLFESGDAPDESCRRAYKYIRTLLLEQTLTSKKTAEKRNRVRPK